MEPNYLPVHVNILYCKRHKSKPSPIVPSLCHLFLCFAHRFDPRDSFACSAWHEAKLFVCMQHVTWLRPNYLPVYLIIWQNYLPVYVNIWYSRRQKKKKSFATLASMANGANWVTLSIFCDLFLFGHWFDPRDSFDMRPNYLPVNLIILQNYLPVIRKYFVL